MSKSKLAIFGGGLAGLSAAFWAKRSGLDFLLYEASDRLGGCIRTSVVPACNSIIEAGPNTISPGAAIRQMLSELKIDLLTSTMASKGRLIFSEGVLHKVASPMDLLFGGVLSLSGKLSLLMEPFKAYPSENTNSTVSEFFARHFGSEFANKIVGAIIGGIYAGDIHRLGIADAMPGVADLEIGGSSLILSALRRAIGENKSIPRRSIASFTGGLTTLISALERFIGPENIKLNSAVERADRGGIVLADGTLVTAEKIIFALPAFSLADICPASFGGLAEVEYAPVVTVNFSVSSDAVGEHARHILMNNFGFLCSPGACDDMLGAVFNSALFPSFAPGDSFLITAFFGGAYHVDVIDRSDSEIGLALSNNIAKILSIDSSGIVIHAINRWRQGIPQYNLGHRSFIQRVLSNLPPNWAMAGNYIGGASLEDTVSSGQLAVKTLFPEGVF